MKGWISICALVCAGGLGCRRAPTSLVVLSPASLEPQIREAASTLARRGTAVALRVARLETQALDSADLIVAQSAAGLAAVAPLLADGRVSFACDDEVVLIGAADEPPAPLARALQRAETVVLADPRGAGEAAEAALGRAGQRVAIATKLRYVAGAAQVIAAITEPDAAHGGPKLGLLLRSDLPAPTTPIKLRYSIVSSGFDGARQCPCAAALKRTHNPALARALLALLAQPGAAHAALQKD